SDDFAADDSALSENTLRMYAHCDAICALVFSECVSFQFQYRTLANSAICQKLGRRELSSAVPMSSAAGPELVPRVGRIRGGLCDESHQCCSRSPNIRSYPARNSASDGAVGSEVG